MKTTDRTAAAIGLDLHRRFSTVTARNAEGKIAWRQRLEHGDRDDLRKRLEAEHVPGLVEKERFSFGACHGGKLRKVRSFYTGEPQWEEPIGRSVGRPVGVGSR